MMKSLRAAAAAVALTVFAWRSTSDPHRPDDHRIPYSARTIAGVVINPDIAVTVPAVWACIKYISESVAFCPWGAFEDLGENGNKSAKSHPVHWLISKRPNPEWSSFQFRETLLHWALRWGNGYAEIERDQFGRPFALWPIHPERVDVCRDPDTGVLFYEVSNGTTGKVEIAARDMFHLRGFGEGPVGVNVIEYAAQSIGWARAAQIFGAAFFGNGATPSVVVRNKKALSPEGLKKQKAEFEQLYKGPARSHRTAHLDQDAEIETVGLDAEKSQLINVHHFLVEEICRWFGVPPHIVAELSRSTNNNIEHQGIEAVQRCLMPWVKRFEDEADYKLFGVQNRRNFYTKINMRALLRGDLKARGEFYKTMRYLGVYNANHILALEDENGIGTDGDKHVMQQQFTTLARIGEAPSDPSGGMAATPSKRDEDEDGDVPALNHWGRTAMQEFYRIMKMEPAHV